LKRSLDALLRDNYPDKEIIVIDGASTDGTVELLKSYENRICKWVSEPDRGEYDATNKGISISTGEIIKQMTDDDVQLPGSLQAAASYFLEHPEVDIVFGQTAFWDMRLDENPVLIDAKPRVDPGLLTTRNWIRRAKTPPCYQAAFFRRRVFDRIGGFATDFVTGDHEFFVRAARAGVKMGIMNDRVVDYYFTGDNQALRKKWADRWGYVRIALRYGDWRDLTYNFWSKVLFLPVWDAAATVAHMLGLHPLRWWIKRRAGINR
jgi:glycosyltransferase involved in cell wall biosynthesis